MRVELEEIVKEELVKKYGEEAVKLDSEMSQLSKLVVKRKDVIKECNRTHTLASLEKYKKVNEEIKKMIKEINLKLNQN